MENVKKFLAVFLSVLLVLSLCSVDAMATSSTDDTETDVQLENGVYCVPMIFISNLLTSTGTTQTADKYEAALIVAEDGQYTVTIRVGAMGFVDTKEIKILKSGYSVDDVVATYSNGSYADSLISEKFSDEDLWRTDVSISYYAGEEDHYADYTFTVSDLSEDIVLGIYYGEAYDTSVRYNKVTFSYTQAVKLPDTIEAGTYNWSYVLDNAFEVTRSTTATSTSALALKGKAIYSDIYDYIDEEVTVEVNEDGTATATFHLTDLAESCGNQLAIQTYDNRADASATYRYLSMIGSTDDCFTAIEVDENNCFTLEFDLSTYDDMVFGKVFRIYIGQNAKGKDVHVYGTLRLAEAAVLPITLEDEATGIQFLTTTANVSTTDTLKVTEITEETDKEAYDLFASNLDGYASDWTAWNVEVVTENGTSVTLSQTGTLKIPIPSGADEDYVVGVTPRNSVLTSEVGYIKDGYLVIDSTTLGQYGIEEKLSPNSTAEGLESGVYKVQWRIEAISGSGASMSDNAFDKPAYIVVDQEAGVVRLQFTQVGVDVQGFSGYLSRAAISEDDGETYTSATVSAYMENEDGSVYTEIWVAGTQVYYAYFADTLYFELPVEHDGAYVMKFRIPIMDGLSKITEGSVGHSDKTANLIIDYSTAELISEDVTEAPIKEALESAIKVLTDIYAHEAEYEPTAWAESDIAELMESVDSIDWTDTDSMKEIYESMQATINDLTDHYIAAYSYADGEYTATPTAADGSTNITEIRMAAVEYETTYHVYTTDVTSLSYYDITTRSYVEATEEDGYYSFSMDMITGGSSTYSTRVYHSVFVQFTDADGEVHTTYLTLADGYEEIDDVDGTALAASIEEATEMLTLMLEDITSYTSEQISELSTALANGNTVYQSIGVIGYMTTQSDVDAAVVAIEEALENAAANVDKSALLEAITNATDFYNALDTSVYTPSSVSALVDTIAAAKEVYIATSPSKYQMAAAIYALTASIESLTERTDTSDLEAVIATAEAIVNDSYSGYDSLQSIISSAKALIASGEASESEVASMINTLTLALSALNDTVNKTNLETMLAEANVLLGSEYQYCSAALYKYFEASVTAAQAVYDDAVASQTEVTKQKTNLVEVSEAMYYYVTDGLFDGVYSISGTFLQTDLETTSMADSAAKEYRIVIENGVPTEVQIRFEALTTTLAGNPFTGHLGWLKYYANYHSTTTPSSSQTATAATIISTYDENNRDDYWEGYMNGVEYPEWVSIPIESYTDEDGNLCYYTQYWVQTFVPVMEAITSGSGTQYALLSLDFDTSTWTQISGAEETDKTALAAMITELEELYEQVKDTATTSTTLTISTASLLTDSLSLAAVEDESSLLLAALSNVSTSNRAENIAVLVAAIEAGYDVYNDLNVSQDYVDEMVEAMLATEALFEAETISTNKATLLASLKEAKTELNRTDITYTEDSLEFLQTIYDAAELVYNSSSADQDQVSFWNDLLQQAIENLTVVEGDKTELKKVLAQAEVYLENAKYYSAAEIAWLQCLYEDALEVYNDSTANQTSVDYQVALLTAYMEQMTPISSSATSVSKQGLHVMIATAANQVGKDTVYTEDSIAALLEAIAEAEAVYDDEEATQTEVNEQASALLLAILSLKLQTTSTSSSTDSSDSSTSSSTDSSDSTTLDVTSLADGVYAVTGYMYKTDKETLSMSNNAIVHTIKLTVENGEYYITMNFNGIEISGSYGYLGDLMYFLSGYTTTNGVPKGDTAEVTVESYQTDDDGELISDDYGTNYPDIVTFPLIAEALEDGWVPLQVFVPIMEAIASGTGTQAVWLYLDWTTIVSTTSDDSSFTSDSSDSTTTTDDDDDDDDDSTSLTGGTSLSSATLSSSSLTSSDDTDGTSLTSSSLSGTSSLSSTSSTSSTSSLKTGDTQTLFAWIGLLLCSALVATVTVLQRKKRNA